MLPVSLRLLDNVHALYASVEVSLVDDGCELRALFLKLCRPIIIKLSIDLNPAAITSPEEQF